jgi:glycosyltransferase involved in cell wall biosynthesis
MKILWLIPKWTYPVSDGARVATDALLRNFVAAGADVTLVCLAQTSEHCDLDLMRKNSGVTDIHVLRRSLPSARIAKALYYFKAFVKNPFLPLTFSSFAKPELKLGLNQILEHQNYDVLFLDGLHLGMPFLRSGKLIRPQKVRAILYRAHNIEADLWKMKASEKGLNFLVRLFIRFQGKLVQKVEEAIVQGSDNVAPIAQEDLEIFKSKAGPMIKLAPLGLNFEDRLGLPSNTSLKFLFIGKLDWAPNRDGLDWFLREVWPEVIKRNSGAVLKIVGSGNRAWLEKYTNLKGLEIMGFVKELEQAYRDCQFTIVPLLYGSGTRIKVIESFVMKRRLISTTMGVLGANLRPRDFVRADTKEEWISILSQIQYDDSHRSQIEDSHHYMARQFGDKEVAQGLYTWIKTCL